MACQTFDKRKELLKILTSLTLLRMTEGRFRITEGRFRMTGGNMNLWMRWWQLLQCDVSSGYHTLSVGLDYKRQ